MRIDKNDILQIVKQDGNAIKFVRNPSEEVKLGVIILEVKQ